MLAPVYMLTLCIPQPDAAEARVADQAEAQLTITG